MSSGELNPSNGSHILAMPYPGRGHINPMINLCTVLSSKGIIVTLVLTEEWLGLIGGSIPGYPDIRLLSIPNVIPSEHNLAANFIGFLNAVLGEMEGPFNELLDRLEWQLSCIVADIFLPWMQEVGIRRGIPIASLSTMVPSVFSVFYHFDLLTARGHLPQENLPKRGEEIIDYIPGMSPMRLADLPHVLVGKSSSFLQHILKAYSSSTKAQAILFTSFYELQPHLINTLRATLPIPIYTIGPSIPHLSLKRPPPPDPTPTRHVLVSQWLDSCPQASVLYVSLGSFLSTSEEKMREFLTGFCDSGVRFLWVARSDMLGLQEACGDAGLVVPWCDQLRVLCHSSVGGFLTHCGWNSTTESIFAGIPMLTFPLFVDQILNSKLIVEDWKVGLRLKERLVGGENVIGRKEICEKVKRLMDLKGEESRELRKRAKELQETCGRANNVILNLIVGPLY